MAVNNTLELLAGFCAEGIAIEITHRSKRRLFGLAGLAPLRDEIASPPRRPLIPVERRTIDFSELDQAMAHPDQAIRDIR